MRIQSQVIVKTKIDIMGIHIKSDILSSYMGYDNVQNVKALNVKVSNVMVPNARAHNIISCAILRNVFPYSLEEVDGLIARVVIIFMSSNRLQVALFLFSHLTMFSLRDYLNPEHKDDVEERVDPGRGPGGDAVDLSTQRRLRRDACDEGVVVGYQDDENKYAQEIGTIVCEVR